MKHSRLLVIAGGFFVSIGAHAGPGAHGPGGEHLDSPGAPGAPSGLARRLPDGSVNVPMGSQRVMGIRTQLAPETETAATVELPGRVVIDPNASGRVQPVHGGRVEPGANGLPVAGQKVQRGQVLAYLRHHAEPYAQATQQAELAGLQASRSLAEQRVKRLESLEGTVPRKEIEAARADLVSLTQREQTIGRSLAVRESLVAPVAGVIARADVTVGQVVNAGETLFEVTDPGRVLVEATTSDVALGQRIGAASLNGVPGVALRFIGAARSLRDGALPLTFRAQPEKPGMSLPLAIGQPVTLVATLNERIKGIVLPAQAIVRNPANEPVAWIKVGAERYLPQRVTVRPLDAATVVVTQGLAADNRVVVQGAPLLAQIR
jgi:cobalt-zinc-cadmium efflux system membrane fusion protein